MRPRLKWRLFLVWAARLAACLAALSLYQTAMAETPPAHLFVEGLKAYRSGDFATAIARFQALAEGGQTSGKLCYNLGNAYLKADRLGPAVWWYEKAQQLIPGDPDLKFNLNYARSLMKDQPEAENPVAKVLFFWRYRLRSDQIQWLALGFNLAFWLTLMGRRLIGRRPYRSWLLILALPALLFTATAAYNAYADRYQRQAIVLPDQLSVRAGRTPGATELFVLHAGTKVRVQARRENHLRIAFGRDKIGWVPAGDLGLL
jgi:tetratricopeptide (TPR) repeat protein